MLETIFFLLVFLLSAIMHEYAHGIIAYAQGDPTAKFAGRLTLNPIPHIDPIGTIILPGMLLLSGAPFLFGWAKPVPYNPYNLKNQRWGPALVGAAGPITNFGIALVFAIILKTAALPEAFAFFFTIIVQANIVLGVFNFIPIPPLDGSKVLFALLPSSSMNLQNTLERYGFFFLLLFLIFGQGILYYLLRIVFQVFGV